MGKEKEDFKRCLMKNLYAPISGDEKVELVRVLQKKGPYCDEMKKLFKK
jgi:hypothetical protein